MRETFPPRSLAFRLLSLASIAILLWPSAGLAYVFREDVDDDWPAITAEFFLHVHTDHLGSSNLYTEGLARTTHGGLRYKKGQLVQRVEYMPFGKERYVLNPGLSEVPKYTGQTYDIDTDLYYYNARYYDPTLARFIQPDTVIPDAYNPQTINPYSYVINNPLRYIDPTGHEGEDYDENGYDDDPTTSVDNPIGDDPVEEALLDGDSGTASEEGTGGSKSGIDADRQESSEGPVVVELHRLEENPSATMGRISIEGETLADTLELPWENNAPRKSRISEGDYLLTLEDSPKFGKNTPTINDVPDRSEIRMHAGNTARDTSGCVLPGEYSGGDYISNSTERLNAIKESLEARQLDAAIRNEPFEVVIRVRDKH